MSLSKIPLIIVVCVAFKKCLTPPNPSPPKEEEVLNANPHPWYGIVALGYGPIVQYIAGILEILTILAYRFPAMPLSKQFLSTFIFSGGHPGDLQLLNLTTLGGFMILAGTLLRLVTHRYLGKFFRYEASIQHDHQLIMDGPYAVVRHPSYSGFLISHPGWFLWSFGQGSWIRGSGLWDTLLGKVIVGLFAVVVIIGNLYVGLGRMSAEDRALQKRFGSKWDEWAHRVRYSVVPGVY